MILTDAERQFLTRQARGHLSTIGSDGTPQVKPLAFSWNEGLETIDITGFNMGASAKYRNVKTNPRAAFVVDEVTGTGMEGVHFLEIRGTAEAAVGPQPADAHLAPEFIRIRPRRVVSFNVEPGHLVMRSRDVG